MKVLFATLIAVNLVSGFAFAGVCERSPIIANAIAKTLQKKCDVITTGDLATIRHLKVGYGETSTGYDLSEVDFDGLTNLESLNLEGPVHLYGLIELSPNAFAPLKNLKILSLNGNCPRNGLHQETFESLTLLQSVDLSNCTNRLTSVPEALFSKNEQIEEIDLSLHHLQYVPKNLFSGLNNLVSINLRGDDYWYTSKPSLLLSENQFAGLRKLRILNLSRNEIAALGTALFHDLHNLETLNLELNKIAALSSRQFEGLSKLRSLKLLSNSLTTVDENIFEGLGELKELYIGNNPLSSTLPKQVFSPLQKLELLNIWAVNKWTSMPGSERLVDLPSLEYSSLKSLKILNLEMTDLTENQYDSIQSQVPWAHVVKNYGD